MICISECYLQQLHFPEICLGISLFVNLFQIMSFIYRIIICNMYIGSVVVKALCCKPEGRGFKSQ
jgi:hypothetical protein